MTLSPCLGYLRFGRHVAPGPQGAYGKRMLQSISIHSLKSVRQVNRDSMVWKVRQVNRDSMVWNECGYAFKGKYYEDKTD